MSIVCVDVEKSICDRAGYIGCRRIIRATIDPTTKHHLNLPENYTFHGALLPKRYQKFGDKIQNFEIREDDTLICGYMKTGSTWIHNIVWQLKNNLNFAVPAKKCGSDNFDSTFFYSDDEENDSLKEYVKKCENNLELFAKLPSPRTLRTHLPAFLLPKDVWMKKAKIIYIARNPKDVIVSRYHMFRSRSIDNTGSLEETCKAFMDDEMVYSPFFEHILSFWQLRHLSNILILTYEELSADSFAGIKRISEFLCCSYEDSQIMELVKHLSFENMQKEVIEAFIPETRDKTQESIYKHCRKGRVGSYREDLTEEWIKRIDDWTAGKLEDTDFRFSE